MKPKKTIVSKIESMRVEDLVPYARNAKRHDAAQVAKIAGSISEFGFANPILIDSSNGVIAGHGRLLAARKLGMESVPCIRLSHLTENQKKAYILADNRLAEVGASWDEEMLKLEIEQIDWAEIKEVKIDDFEFGEIEFGKSEDSEKEVVEDEAPEPPDNPVSKLGDIWMLGEHRLFCGDSTIKINFEQLMNGEVADMMVTDPPYGVEYDANWRNETERSNGKKIGARAIGKVLNDDRADWSDAWALFQGNVAYVWHASSRSPEVAKSLESNGLEIRAMIIWAKNQMCIGRGDYHWKHEPCWYVVRKGKPSKRTDDRTQTTLWEIDKPRKSETGHSTQKPVECMARPIRNHEASLIYDPFLGSGTTLIASEQLGKRCYGFELNPAYCDVIIQRWETLTGKKAKKE
jgi:DNA modification methylase